MDGLHRTERRLTIPRGAVSVGTHVLAYNGRDDGLFHGAISQSGSPAGLGPGLRTVGKGLSSSLLL